MRKGKEGVVGSASQVVVVVLYRREMGEAVGRAVWCAEGMKGQVWQAALHPQKRARNGAVGKNEGTTNVRGGKCHSFNSKPFRYRNVARRYTGVQTSAAEEGKPGGGGREPG